METNEYIQYIEKKRHITWEYWFDCIYMPEKIFDFQTHIIEKAVKKWRMGIFLDTWLWKTRISLSIAQNIVLKTNWRVLILTPLSVAFQFIKEANEIWIDDIEYSKDGKFTKKIVICNYERLHYFNSNDFECVILDESSILKNFKGMIKTRITSFVRKVKYRFLTTATPSPNDFVELWTSSEALWYMWYMDMLARFFRNNQNDTWGNSNIWNKFYLKQHAENSFFQRVNTRAIMSKRPSDLWFSDDRYILPSLHVNKHIIEIENEKEWCETLFEDIERQKKDKPKTMTEVRLAWKNTEQIRCEKAVELARWKTSVYRCNTNNESALLKQLDPEAVEVIGSQTIEQKEKILEAFSNGEIKRIITKATITWMWLNRQHCNHCVFFPTWSYEQYYQAIRRFWRFWQMNDVYVDMVYTDSQSRVIDAINLKIDKAEKLYKKIIENVNKDYKLEISTENWQVSLPSFIS